MESELTSPRPLAESEKAELRDVLRLCLDASTPDDEEDAENLLDYAMDMIESGESVGHVAEELRFMEMSACDDEASERLGECLTIFLSELDEDAGGPQSNGEEKSSKAEARSAEPMPTPVKTAAPAKTPNNTPKTITPTPKVVTPAPAPPARSYSSRSSYSATPPSRSSYSSPSVSRSASVSSQGSKLWMQNSSAADGASPADPYNCKSSPTRRQSEMKAAFGASSSVKDRMKAFNNTTTVNFDPVHFVVRQNKAEKARREAQRAAKESAKRFQVNETIATKTAESFKELDLKIKSAKKESIERAKLNRGAGTVVSIHDTAPGFKKMLEERKAKKKEAVQTAMKYNYKYGDGSVVDETSAEFKRMGDTVKAKKKESKETAMRYNYRYGDGGVVDDTSAEFKALGDDIKTKKKESKETAMRYNYQYGDGGVVDETSAEFKALGDNVRAKKIESKENAMRYNYRYGDGGVADETSAEFKASGDNIRTAKVESKQTAMMYNYRYGDGGATEEESARFEDPSDQRKVAKARSEEINSGFDYVYRAND